MPQDDICRGCGKAEAVEDRLCASCHDKVGREDDYSTQSDNTCADCDSTGEIGGRVCRTCQGKGYVSP